jgi:DNA repair protein SbcC/Rad50
MRILRVDAHAFGPFRGETLELTPGMNLLFGPNEAGKSSWHAALYAGLCGMRRAKGAPRKPDREFAERHRPWDGDRWEAGVRLELADGRTIELRHDLAGLVDCWAKDLATGMDISDQLMNEQTPDGARFLGLSRDVMLATACVRQAEILDVLRSPDRLQESLQAAAASGGGDVTAQAAIERLERFRRAAVGTDRTRTAPLDEAIRALEDARSRALEAEVAHSEYLELVRQHERAQEEAERARAELLAGRLEVLDRRLERARTLAAGLPEDLPDPGSERELVAQVGDALSLWRSRPPRPEPPEGPTAADLREEIAQLPDPPRGDVEAHASVASAEQAWRSALARRDAHLDQEPQPAEVPVTGVTGGELRRLADDLAAEVPPVDPDLEQRVTSAGPDARPQVATGVLAAGAVLVVLGLLLAASGIVAAGVVSAFAGMAAAGWGWWRSGQATVVPPEDQAELALQRQTRGQAEGRRQRAGEEVAHLGLERDPDSLRRLALRLDEVAGDADRRDRWEERFGPVRDRVVETERELRQALADRGVADAEATDADVDALLDRYRRDCRERSRRAAEAARREHLTSQLEARRSIERGVEADRAARTRAAGALRAAAQAAGIDGAGGDDTAGDQVTGDVPDEPALDQLAVRLATWREEQERDVERVQQLHRRRATLDELLGGRPLETLEDERARLRRDAVPLPDVGPVELGDDPEGTLARLQDRAQRSREHVADLGGRVTTIEETLIDVAGAQEAVRRLEAEVARLRTLGATVETTLGFLTRAREQVQRDVAPRLAEVVARHLPRITDGRYTEVTVDPEELAVEVRDAEGRWLPATRLSHGTAEQIHLLLRLAMTEHLVTTDEPAPLILDDVTVQSDRARTTAFLDLLHDLSLDRQVILFSQELEVLDWAEGRLKEPDDLIVTLPPPAGAEVGGR